LTVAGFVAEIRKHIHLEPNTAIFLLVNDNVLPQSSSLMSQVYEKNQDEDGFLYIVYSGESYFG